MSSDNIVSRKLGSRARFQLSNENDRKIAEDVSGNRPIGCLSERKSLTIQVGLDGDSVSYPTPPTGEGIAEGEGACPLTREVSPNARNWETACDSLNALLHGEAR